MSDDIRVHVVKYPDRTNLMMRYRDPYTGKHVAKSAGTADLKKATREAAKWEDQLQSGRYLKPTRMIWDAFREYYTAHALPPLAERSQQSYESTLNVFERMCLPQRLADVTTARVTAFATAMRSEGRSESTVARHLRHLKAATRWANREGLLATVPAFTMPKRVKGMKIMRGRPITAEEFDRMIKSVPKVVENVAAKSWEFYLRGLWESGLRLSESLSLRWDDARGAIVVDYSRKRPLLRIPAEAEKAYKDRLLPITPEFAKLLDSVPEHDRRGRVFKLLAPNGVPMHVSTWEVSRIVSNIGRAAGIVVDEREKRAKDSRGNKANEIVKKFASAHDLRRAFGQRWASRVMPPILQQLMRHESVETTMKYYVGQDADAAADVLWEAVGNSSGNRRHLPAPRHKRQSEKNS